MTNRNSYKFTIYKFYASSFLLLTTLLSSSSANASFKVCNQTLDVANVAIGQWDFDRWETLGWWTIGPNQCSNVIEQTLISRYVYVYARDVFNRSLLVGDLTMCVDKGEFRIIGQDNCAVRGKIPASFAEIDTKRSERWTFFITMESK